jgi:hypothetical protein
MVCLHVEVDPHGRMLGPSISGYSNSSVTEFPNWGAIR